MNIEVLLCFFPFSDCNTYLNDVKTVAVKKAWNNQGYPGYYSGKAEDMQADATNTGLSIVINDSVFNAFDVIHRRKQDFLWFGIEDGNANTN